MKRKYQSPYLEVYPYVTDVVTNSGENSVEYEATDDWVK